MSIIPSINLVTNIGFGAEGTHCLNQNSILANIPQEKISFPLKHPHLVERHLEADEFEETTLYSVRETKKLERIREITPNFDTTIFPVKKHFVPELPIIKIAHIINLSSASKTSSLLAELPTNASWEDYYQLAEKFYKQGELDSAITAYQKVIEINPKHSWSYHKLGNIFRE